MPKSHKSNSNKKTKKCLSCVPTTGLIAKTTKKRANWKTRRGLKTIFPDDKMPSLVNPKLVHPKDYDQTVQINLGKEFKNRYILFYAAKKNKSTDCEKIKTASEAYDKFNNRGMTKTNSKGIANLKLKCPQVYQEEGEVYFSHVHFIVSNKDNSEWIDELKTKNVVCMLDHKTMYENIQSGCTLVLNALPIDEYIKDRIPHSYTLPHTSVLKTINEEETKQYIKDLLIHSYKLQKYISNKKLELFNVPIITYCYSEDCTADTDLQQKLNKIGFKNVKVYSPGITGWRKHFGKIGN